MWKTAFSIVLSLLLCSTAMAQIPTKGNVFFGYSYGSADSFSTDRANLNGWNGSVEGKVLPWVGIVGDFSGLYGSQTVDIACPGAGCISISADAKVHNFLFGPRVSVSIGKIRPFAHALFGASHISASAAGFSDSDTSLEWLWEAGSITTWFLLLPGECRPICCRRASLATLRTISAFRRASCSISRTIVIQESSIRYRRQVRACRSSRLPVFVVPQEKFFATVMESRIKKQFCYAPVAHLLQPPVRGPHSSAYNPELASSHLFAQKVVLGEVYLLMKSAQFVEALLIEKHEHARTERMMNT